jgi:hypothetical protein
LLPIFLDEGEFRACEEYMIPFALPHYGIDFPNQDDGKPDGTVYFKIMELN